MKKYWISILCFIIAIPVFSADRVAMNSDPQLKKSFVRNKVFQKNVAQRQTTQNKEKDDTDKDQRFPSRCVPQGFMYKNMVLHLYPHKDGNLQSMYFIHNLTDSSIMLRQIRRGDEPFVMHLNNEIKPLNWAVFSTNDKVVKFICTQEKDGKKYGEILDCSKVLDICEYPNVEFAIINRGDYWIVDSASMKNAQRTATRKGAYLYGRDPS